MKDDTWMIIPAILLLLVISGTWFNFGTSIGNEQGRHKTVVLCVEKPQQCKEIYEFLKLREKLGE